MKKQIHRTVTTFGLFSILALVAAVSPAQAQSPVSISVDVPFDFYVGDLLMPAGRYTVKRAMRDTNRTLLIAGDKEGERAAAMTAPVVGRAAKQSTLVFHRYGAEYFLRSTWTMGETEGREFSQSKQERAARERKRQLTRQGGEGVRPEVVEVTANR